MTQVLLLVHHTSLRKKKKVGWLFNNSDLVWGVSTGGDHSRCRLGIQNVVHEFDTLADGGPGYKAISDSSDG